MIDRNIEKALQLLCVQIHRQHAVCAGDGYQIRHKFCRNGHAAFILAVLPGIAEIRDHRRYPRCTCAFETIEENQKLHQILIHRSARRLHHKAVAPANIVLKLDEFFAVRKYFYLRAAQRNAEIFAYLGGQIGICRAAEYFNIIIQKHLFRTSLSQIFDIFLSKSRCRDRHASRP